MTILRVTFLGTSAAQPTLRRGLSATAVRAHSDRILFDCGEGTQRQMLKYGTGFRLDAVFFTHFHADHYLGIVGFLRTLSMAGREEPLTLYGPGPHVRSLLSRIVELGIDRLSFPVSYVELQDGDVVERRQYWVRAVAVDHRMPALGYVLEEPERPGVFDVERARRAGVLPGPSFKELQDGRSVTNAEGRTVTPDEVLGPARPGRKLALSGDTRPCEAFADAARDADLLIHEATFSASEQERAEETHHSTALEAAQIASRAQAKQLVLTHLSSRYDASPEVLLEEAGRAFQGLVSVAYDGLELEMKLRQKRA